MAFNNPFIPSSYAGYFNNGYAPTAPAAAPPMPQQPPQPQMNNGIIWVQGEAAAKSYLVAPSATVLLMDSDASRFYLKSADPSGMPSMRTFEYKELTFAPMAPQPKVDYVTREEYNALSEQIHKLAEKVEKKNDKKVVKEDAEPSV